MTIHSWTGVWLRELSQNRSSFLPVVAGVHTALNNLGHDARPLASTKQKSSSCIVCPGIGVEVTRKTRVVVGSWLIPDLVSLRRHYLHIGHLDSENPSSASHHFSSTDQNCDRSLAAMVIPLVLSCRPWLFCSRFGEWYFVALEVAGSSPRFQLCWQLIHQHSFLTQMHWSGNSVSTFQLNFIHSNLGEMEESSSTELPYFKSWFKTWLWQLQTIPNWKKIDIFFSAVLYCCFLTSSPLILAPHKSSSTQANTLGEVFDLRAPGTRVLDPQTGLPQGEWVRSVPSLSPKWISVICTAMEERYGPHQGRNG